MSSPPFDIEEALRLAQGFQRHNQHADAYALYLRILDACPGHAAATHFLGLLAHQVGEFDEALRLVEASLALAPDEASFHSNYGNLLFLRERIDDARVAYQRALTLAPEHVEALNNVALALRGLGEPAAAEAAWLRAIALAPDFLDARHNLAHFYLRQGRKDEAIAHSAELLLREPRTARSSELLGFAYGMLGRVDEARAVYEAWLGFDPDNPRALHYLAALQGPGAPARASDAYVQSLFDSFAGSFDAKLAKLDYRAPSLIEAALAQAIPVPDARLRVLDVGCGTGLCAPFLRPYAVCLAGVDLSAGMLKRARDRGGYDALAQAELTAYLDAHPACYELIVSADTLVYLGALDAALGAAGRALVPGGLLCFTVESLAPSEAGDYTLRYNGRYAHARAYLETCLAAAGLQTLTLDAVSLRIEGADWVQGWLVLARRTATGARADD